MPMDWDTMWAEIAERHRQYLSGEWKPAVDSPAEMRAKFEAMGAEASEPDSAEPPHPSV
jgi:hypothetical protein